MRLWDVLCLWLLLALVCNCHLHNVSQTGQSRLAKDMFIMPRIIATIHKGIGYFPWSQSLSLRLAYGHYLPRLQPCDTAATPCYCFNNGQRFSRLCATRGLPFYLEFPKPPKLPLHCFISRIISVSQVSQPCTEHSTVGRMGPFRTHLGSGPKSYSFTPSNKYRLN